MLGCTYILYAGGANNYMSVCLKKKKTIRAFILRVTDLKLKVMFLFYFQCDIKLIKNFRILYR